MKKFIVLICFGLLLANSIHAQVLERGIWQWQNPNSISTSSTLVFKNGSVYSATLDLNTNQAGQVSGTYRYVNNNLTVAMNGAKYVYGIRWVNKNKFVLESSGGKLIYAQANTADDTYFSRYMAWYGMNWSNPNQNYNSPQQPRQEICYTCHGRGSCLVCGGTGQYHNPYVAGDTHPCSACGGNGKCWHCHGSGIQ